MRKEAKSYIFIKFKELKHIYLYCIEDSFIHKYPKSKFKNSEYKLK